MAVPREDYDVRLRWTNPSALTSNVLDLVPASHDEVVALVAWEARSDGAFVQAGLSVIRFTATGNIRWQSTHTLCQTAGTDCGKWVLTLGAITTDDGKRFIAIATIVDQAKPGVFQTIGIGVDDGGAVAWCQQYQTTLSIGRAIGIAPLAKPGEFLVVSRNADQTATWLYGIDRNGALLTTVPMIRFAKRFVQRLRAVPGEGLFILGTSNEDPDHPLGWIMNIDPSTAGPSWERTYDPHDETHLCWYDITKAADSLIAVGNAGPVARPTVATLDAGDVRSAFRPAAEDAGIFVNGIANVRTPESTSSICGALDGAAWHIAIDDAVNFRWQKKYNHGGSSASLTPVLFTNNDAVVAGGLAIVPGDPLRALLVQSKVAIGSPAPFGCGEETRAVFERIDLSSEVVESKPDDLIIFAYDWYVNQAPLIEREEGCLP